MKVLFTGGGSGGHLFPIVAVIRELKKIYPKKDLTFFYIGPKDDFASIVLNQEGVVVKTILAGKVRRYLSPQNISDILFKLPVGTIQAFFRLFTINPDIVFCKGGYGSLPTIFAVWLIRIFSLTLFKIPIVLHESDFTPGLANKILSKLAMENFVSFQGTEFFPHNKMMVVGNPVREHLLTGSGEEAWECFNLEGSKPLILILGGSQGAQAINDIILTILEEILQDFELIHQCGDKNYRNIRTEADARLNEDQKARYHLLPFIREHELRHAYHAAGLIVARAGSGLIFEIAALGKPSILIPLPTSAQDHQLKNAYSFAADERAMLIEESNLTPHFFLERIKYLFAHPSLLKRMGENARQWSKPRAAHIIADYIKEYLLT